ncbi:MAG: uracil-DNA glycosylase family protein [Pseudomonadota bacterium]
MLQDALLEIHTSIRGCRICAEKPCGKPLPHEPRPVVVPSSTARMCIAGQAPGTRVHASGRPFTDPSGDRLRDWMGVDEHIFYDADKLAIVPMGFCFPGLDAKGGDLPPRKECVATWHDRLFDLMPQIELVLVIGQYAQAYHMASRRSKTLTETVASWRSHFAQPINGKLVLPLPHPSWRNNAWLKRNPWFEAELLPVLKSEVAKRL